MPGLVDQFKLNPEQKKGVLHDKGPMLILAGAGSGKTRVITTRMASLIADRGVSARHILALTFTNKAAREMKERVASLLSRKAIRGLFAGTFHAFGVMFLKKHIPLLGFRDKFSIFNTGDKIHLLTNIMKDLKCDLESLPPEEVAWKISAAKNALVHPEQASAYFQDRLLSEIYGYYQRTLKGFNVVDFDDLLMLTVDLLRQEKDLCREYSHRFRYIMVDEYQDTNFSQYTLLRLLTREHDNICVVGDDDQSIYAWRGADITNILNFEKDFPGTEVIRLEQNYRSSAVILEAANAIISNNSARKGKKLWTSGERGDKITVISAGDEVDEAESVGYSILRLREDYRARYSDFAVVFRTNFQTRPFEEAFTRLEIPYEVIGGTRFFDRKEVKDVVCYLRLLANRHDEIALLRIINKPKRGIGPQTIEKIIRYAEQHDLYLYQVLGEIDRVEGIDAPVAHNINRFYETIEEFGKKIFKQGSMVPVVKSLIQEIGYEDELLRDAGMDANKYQRSLQFVQGVVNSIAVFEHDETVEKHDLFSYLEKIALMTSDDNDEKDKKRNAVTLLTMHSCKGLEFPYVYISAVEEGSIPHSRSIEEGEDKIEEERRLFYVGVTRAMKTLYLTFAGSRRRYGEEEETMPSRFLEEIPAELLDFTDSGDSEPMSENDLNAGFEALQAKWEAKLAEEGNRD